MNPDILLSRIHIVLCRPSHPGNIGAAARAMKTMGLTQLHLVKPKSFPDAVADERATGAIDVLHAARVHDTLTSALSETHYSIAMTARRRELVTVVADAREMALQLAQAALQGPVALVFGNETSGLQNDELELCRAAASIPTNPDFSSLNLGAAVQVMAYEVRMALLAGVAADTPKTGADDEQATPATQAEFEGLISHLRSVMIETGFLNPARPGRLIQKVRRLFGRTQLERDEINILRGILSATQQPTGHAGWRPPPRAEVEPAPIQEQTQTQK